MKGFTRGARGVAVALLFTLAPLLAPALCAQPAANPQVQMEYYASVVYILSARTTTSLLIRGGETLELTAPPPPPGYNFYFMRLSFPSGLPKNVVAVRYSRAEAFGDRVNALVSYDGSIRLASSDSNVEVQVGITVYYVRSRTVKLAGNRVNFTVEELPPPFTKNDLTVRFTIDNHAPFAVRDVLAPSGESLVGSEPSPEALKVDYKHVELNFNYLDLGTYTIVLSKGADYALPPSFIVVEPPFKQDSLAPGAAKKYGVTQVRGWRSIGAVVVVYSIAPLAKKGGDVEVAGELTDFAYYRDEVISIRAASFLIPTLHLRVHIKAYLVYGTWFEVRNNMKSSVNVLYTSVLIRDAGEWTPTGVKLTVQDSDVKDAMAAYLVVQAPRYANIISIRTPSGEVGGTKSGLLPWGDSYRSVEVFMNQAYIQVKAEDLSELGSYTFSIEWRPIRFKLVDDGGAPIAGAHVSVRGPIEASTPSDGEGIAQFKIYKPGPYTVSVRFKWVTVAEVGLGSIVEENITLKCNVYRVSWLVVDMWGRPLQGAEITVMREGSVVERLVTNERGVTDAAQIPGGQFVMKVGYKRLQASRVEEISGGGVRRVKVDMLFEIPLFGGIPVMLLEAALGGALVGGGALGLAVIKRGRPKTVEEIELEE